MPEWVAIVLTFVLVYLALWVLISVIVLLVTGDIEETVKTGFVGMLVIGGIALFVYLLSLVFAAIWAGVK